MKTLLFTVVALFIVNNVFATVRTLSNHAAGGSQYTNLQSAYTACVNGDTLIVEGTDIDYFMTASTRWDKSIVVIGIGYNPQKQTPKKVRFRRQNDFSEFQLGTGAAGSRFYGITFVNQVRFGDGVGMINNLTFEDCYFPDFVIPSGSGTSGLIITNCVFDNDNVLNFSIPNNQSTVVTINNSIFDGYVEGNGSGLGNVEFNHCLFSSTSGTHIFNNLYYSTIRNCIFMNRFPAGTTGLNSFLNNLCRVAGTFPPPGAGNTASGNLEATDPLFVNNPVNVLYNTTRDFHLQAGSPAIGAANDGTDIGLHGGFTGFSEQLESLINPIIRSMSILNTSVASNGTLNVQIQATKPDNN